MKRRQKFSVWLGLLLLGALFFALSVFARLVFFDHAGFDQKVFMGPLYRFFNGSGLGGLGTADMVSGASVMFQYLILLATLLPFKGMVSTKIVFVLFDYLAALFLYFIVRSRLRKKNIAIFAPLIFLFAPTVVANASMMSQYDSVYTALLLMALYLFIVSLSHGEKDGRLASWLGIGMFSLAFSFKLQAVFFVLPIIFLTLKNKIKWYQLLVVPVIWIASMVPASLAGRSWTSLLLIYPGQMQKIIGKVHCSLVSCAPSLMHFLSDWPREQMKNFSILLAITVVLFLVLALIVKRIPASGDVIVKLSFLSSALVPFMLFGMFDRYFFLADAMALVYAFYFPVFWYIPVVMFASSALIYPNNATGLPVSLFFLSLVMAVIIIIVIKDIFMIGQVVKHQKE